MKIRDMEIRSVRSRNGKTTGRPTGGLHPCTLEGCRGSRVAVRWPNGQITFPCTRGMNATKRGDWRIR